MKHRVSDIDFELLFNSAPGLYLVLLPDLTIVAVSDTYLKATMTKRKEILGRNLFEVFPDNPEELNATGTTNLRASLARVLKEGVSDTMAIQKYDIRRPESEGGAFEVRYWSPVNSPVFGPDGQLQFIIHRVEDVTEFVRLKGVDKELAQQSEDVKTKQGQFELELYNRAQELQQLNKKLAATNQALIESNLERDQLLKRLAEANTALSTSNKELEAFTYSVSHDLRAPLRSLAGFSSMIMESDGAHLSVPGQDSLKRVIGASQKMGRLIDGLLDLSRLSKKELLRKPVSLTEIAHNVVSQLKETAPHRKIECLIDGNLLVHGDEKLLEVVVQNLIGNAWKFTSKKENANIEIGKIEKDGQTVFFVKDDGVGFDMAYANKLFGAFQRLHSSKEFDGTGIGLATVMRIINRHGGKIWAESKVDGGATFYFTL